MAEVTVNCPFCERRGLTRDRKRNLNLNPGKNYGHCFRCGWGTYHAREVVVRLRLPVPPGLRWGDTVLPGVAPGERPAPVALPPFFTTQFTGAGGPDALEYLTQKRELSLATIFGYQLGHCPYGTYGSRVVIPAYIGGDLRTWQARSYLPGVAPPYLGPRQPGRGVVPFNIDRVSPTGVLCLVEGPFDALAIPTHGVAFLGKAWSDAHREAVLSVRPHTVLVGLDADADDDAAAIAAALWGLVPHVIRVQLGGPKDFGECSVLARTTWMAAFSVLQPVDTPAGQRCVLCNASSKPQWMTWSATAQGPIVTSSRPAWRSG